MSSMIPMGFVGKKSLQLDKMSLTQTIREAVSSYQRMFDVKPDICFVQKKLLEGVINDEHESKTLAEICAEVSVVPVDASDLGGPYAWAGCVPALVG